MLEIYKFINELQDEIGNGAKVRLSASDGELELRVDWWEKDLHARYLFTEKEMLSYAMRLKYFVAWCKKEYAEMTKGWVTMPEP